MKGRNRFSGFTEDTVTFLNELRGNNSKTWFEANRDRYMNSVYYRFMELASLLADTMSSIDPRIELRPEKVVSRIYRDTRFSHDKSPYKHNVWLSFKRADKNWIDAPAFYFEVTPDFWRYGMGFYNATRQTMDSFRKELTERRDEFLKISSSIRRAGIFSVEGEDYKRKIENILPDELQSWYQKKSFYLVRNVDSMEQLVDGSVADILEKGFRSLEPLYRFIWSAKGEIYQALP